MAKVGDCILVAKKIMNLLSRNLLGVKRMNRCTLKLYIYLLDLGAMKLNWIGSNPSKTEYSLRTHGSRVNQI